MVQKKEIFKFKPARVKGIMPRVRNIFHLRVLAKCTRDEGGKREKKSSFDYKITDTLPQPYHKRRQRQSGCTRCARR